MGVGFTRVDLQAGVHRTALTAFGQHAEHSVLNDALGVLGQRFAGGFGLQAALVAGVAGVDLVVQLLAGQGHLLGVDDHHEVTLNHVGGEVGAVLATNARSDQGGEAAEGHARGVHHDPVLLVVFGDVGFHLETP